MRVRHVLRSDWRAYATAIAYFQTAILLALSYLLLVGPVWLAARVSGRSFLPYRRAGSTWLPRDPKQASLRDLRRPY